MSNYGYFNEAGNEYIITKADAPRRFQMNYMQNGRYLAAVNHFGTGKGAYQKNTSFYMDKQGRGRCYLVNDGNRYLYIKDKETGKHWSPGWSPVREKLDFYECRHGIGYTYITGEKDGVLAKWRLFVNENDPAEIWTLTLENKTDKEKTLEVFSCADVSLEGYTRKNGYRSWVNGKIFADENMAYVMNPDDAKPHSWYNGFITSDVKAKGYDTSRVGFLGAFGTYDHPDSIDRGVSNSEAASEGMLLALQHEIVIPAGETKVLNVILGVCDCKETAVEIKNRLTVSGVIDKCFDKVRENNKKIQDISVIETPDEKVNFFTNYWLKAQIMLCAEIGRGQGKGFRDQLQDAWGCCAFKPEFARDKIYETLQNIYKSGLCIRGWQPLNPRIASDNSTWIAPTVNAYLKETGDYDFLKEKVKYLDEGEDTVWEHMLTAVRYSCGDVGVHGIVKIHSSDWNDSINGMGKDGKGESAWVSIALYNALNAMEEIARVIVKDEVIAQEMRDRAEKVKKAVEEYAWDGEWYIQGYTDDGVKVGSRENKEGMIYLNSQAWAILSGLADEEKKAKCLDAIDKYLESENGTLTLYPVYRTYDENVGRITGFVPGVHENSAPYCHGCTFKLISDIVAGRPDKAYETLLKVMPDSKHNPSENSGAEPYVLTNMYLGPEHPRAGQTLISWVTGTAGWVYRLITEYMVGFKVEYDKIVIAPCLPSAWDKVNYKRLYNGSVYDITIYNNSDKKLMLVDGAETAGNSVPKFNDNKTHNIEVYL